MQTQQEKDHLLALFQEKYSIFLKKISKFPKSDYAVLRIHQLSKKSKTFFEKSKFPNYVRNLSFEAIVNFQTLKIEVNQTGSEDPRK
jgi:hypothetical protein